jgi:hypothetical protein
MAQSSGAAGPSVEDALASLGFALKYIETCERVDSRESAVAQLLEAAGVLQRKAVALGDRSLSGTMNLSDTPGRSNSQNTKDHSQSGQGRVSMSQAMAGLPPLAPHPTGNESSSTTSSSEPTTHKISPKNAVQPLPPGGMARAMLDETAAVNGPRPRPPSVNTGPGPQVNTGPRSNGSSNGTAQKQRNAKSAKANNGRAPNRVFRSTSVVVQEGQIKQQLATRKQEVRPQPPQLVHTWPRHAAPARRPPPAEAARRTEHHAACPLTASLSLLTPLPSHTKP